MSGEVYKCHVFNSCRSHLGTHRCRDSFRDDARSIVFFVLEGVRGCGRLLPKKFLTTKKKRKKKNKKKIGTCLSRYVFSILINTSHSADWIKKWVMFYTKLEDIPLLVLTPVTHFL